MTDQRKQAGLISDAVVGGDVHAHGQVHGQAIGAGLGLERHEPVGRQQEDQEREGGALPGGAELEAAQTECPVSEAAPDAAEIEHNRNRQ